MKLCSHYDPSLSPHLLLSMSMEIFLAPEGFPSEKEEEDYVLHVLVRFLRSGLIDRRAHLALFWVG